MCKSNSTYTFLPLDSRQTLSDSTALPCISVRRRAAAWRTVPPLYRGSSVGRPQPSWDPSPRPTSTAPSPRWRSPSHTRADCCRWMICSTSGKRRDATQNVARFWRFSPDASFYISVGSAVLKISLGDCYLKWVSPGISFNSMKSCSSFLARLTPDMELVDTREVVSRMPLRGRQVGERRDVMLGWW